MPQKATTQIVKFDIETAVITALDAKYKDIIITDGKSYDFVMEGLAEYRGLRLSIDAKHKELKADALAYGRAVDAEKRRLKGLLEPGESKLKEIRQAEDDRKAKIKAEKERIERERVEGIRAKIDEIHLKIIDTQGKTSDEIIDMQLELEDTLITEDEFQEFIHEANRVFKETSDTLDRAYKDRLKLEKEEAERKAENKRLEEEAARQAEAQKKLDKERNKLEAEKKAEQDRKNREQLEKELKEKAKKDVKEKLEREEKDRKEKAEAEEAEKKRQEALRPDKDKLQDIGKDILNWGFPNMISKDAKEVISWLQEQLELVIGDFRKKINEL